MVSDDALTTQINERAGGKRKRPPERICALTRIRRADADLLRFAVDPHNRVVPDIHRKLPGRGLWLKPTREAVLEAVKRKVFAHGFKAQVEADAGLADLIDRLLMAAALQSLSMAKKAGQTVTGFTKIEKLIGQGGITAILHAADAGADGCQKIDQKYRAAARSRGENTTILSVFSSSQLSMALGRENVIHAALINSAISDACLRTISRWQIYNGVEALPDTAAVSATKPIDQD